MAREWYISGMRITTGGTYSEFPG